MKIEPKNLSSEEWIDTVAGLSWLLDKKEEAEQAKIEEAKRTGRHG